MNYYLDKYMNYNPTYIAMLSTTETKAETKSLKQRIIEDIKAQEYPKGATKELVSYIKTL